MRDPLLSVGSLRSRFAIVIALTLFALGSPADAQIYTWTNGGGNNQWSNDANWSTADPTTLTDLLFPAPTAGSGTITLNAGELANSLTFRESYTLSGGDLTLTSGFVTVAPSFTATIHSQILGTNGLTLAAFNSLASPDDQAGGGTLVLTNAANSFTGAISIQAGTVRFADIAALNLSNTANTISLGTNSTAGTLDYTGSTATITRTITLGDSTTGSGVINVATVGQRLTIGGVISGGTPNSVAAATVGNTSLTISGAGEVALTGTNTFTGNILIDGGTLVFSGTDSQLGSTPVGQLKSVILQNGGRLNLTGTYNPGSNTTTSAKRVLMGTGGGTLDIASGATLTLDDANQFGGSGPLTKTGAGLFVIAGNHNYSFSGAVDINEGTIRVSANASKLTGTALITIANGATYDLQTTQSTSRPISVEGAGDGGNGALISGAGTVTFGNTVTLTGDVSLGGNGFPIISNLNGGGETRTITKVGTGLLTIAANSNFTGTTTITGTGGVALSAPFAAPVVITITTTPLGEIVQNGAAVVGSTYTVPTDGILGGNTAFLSSLTVGGNLTNAFPTTIAQTAIGVNAALASSAGFANDASRFFAIAANVSGETATIGTGTPWGGLSNDRAARSLSSSTITFASDIIIRATNGATFTIGNGTTAGVNTFTTASPVIATIAGGNVVLDDATPGFSNNLTFSISSGASLQTVQANALGTGITAGTSTTNANIVVQSGGMLNPNGGASLNGPVTVLSGGILNLDDASNISGVGTITQSAGSIIRILNQATALNGAQSPGSVAGTRIQMNVSNITQLNTKISAAAHFEFSGADRTQTTTPIDLGTGGDQGKLTLTDTVTSRTLTVTTINIGDGGGLLGAPAGRTLTLAGNPTITDGGGGHTLTIGSPTSIDGQVKTGSISISGSNAGGISVDAVNIDAGTLVGLGGGMTFTVGSGTGFITVADGATLDTRTSTLTNGQLNILSGGIARFRNGSTDNSVATAAVAGLQGEGSVFLGNNTTGTNRDLILTIAANDVSSTFSGVIANSDTAGGDNGGITKVGTGTLELTGANTYSLATTIAQGTITTNKILVSGGNSSLGNASSSVTLGSAGTPGTLVYTGSDSNYTRGFTIGDAGGRFDVSSSTATVTILTGSVTGAGAGSFTVGGAGDTVINSLLSLASGNLVKEGTGILTLNNSAISIGGAVNVNAGTLRFTDTATVSAVNVATNATLSVRIASETTLTTGVLSFGNDASLTVSVGSLANAANPIVAASSVIMPSAANPLKLNVVAGSGFNNSGLNTYTILNSIGGGLSGAANSNVILNSTFGSSTFTLSDDANNLYLSIETYNGALYWKGNVDGGSFNWSTVVPAGTNKSNWTSDADGLLTVAATPGLLTDVTFSASGATNNAASVVDVNSTTKSLTILDPAATLIKGANTTLLILDFLTVNNGQAVTFGSPTVGQQLQLSISKDAVFTNSNGAGGQLSLINGINSAAISGTQTLTFAGTGDFVVQGAVTDGLTGGLLAITSSTAGEVTLAGANTYTGLTTVTAGTLTFSGVSSIGGLTLTGGTLNVNSSTTTSGALVMNRATILNVGSGGILTLGNASHLIGTGTPAGTATVNVLAGGRIAIGAGAGTTIIGNGTSVNNVGVLDASAATGEDAVAVNVATFILGQSSASNTGRGTLLLPTSATATSTIRATTSVIVSNSLGTGASSVTSLLDFGGGTVTIDSPSLLVGGRKTNGSILSTTAGGTLVLKNGAAGKMNLNVGDNNPGDTATQSVGLFDSTGGTIQATLGNVLIGRLANGTSGAAAGSGSFIIDGAASTVTLDALSLASRATGGTATGVFTVKNGTVTFNSGGTGIAALTAPSATSVSTVNVLGGILDLNGKNIGSVSAVTLSGGTLANVGTFSAPVAFNFNGGTFLNSAVVGQTVSFAVVQTANATAGSLMQVNSGQGTTIDGTYSLTGFDAANTAVARINGQLTVTSVAVNDFAVLGGAGTVNSPVTAASGATVAPGATGASSGTLTVTDAVTFQPGATFAFELTVAGSPSAAPGGSSPIGTHANHDVLVVNGALNFDGTPVNIATTGLAGASGINNGSSYSWLIATSTSPIVGTPTLGTVSGDFATYAGTFGNSLTIDVVGNNLYLNATVPEPGTILGLTASAMGATVWLRRRRAARA